MRKRWGSLVFGVVFFVSLITLSAFNKVFAQADEYRYDDLNRLKEVIYDSGDRVVYTYDAAGNITETKKIIASPDSIKLNYSYMPLKVGEKKQLQVTASYSDGRGDLAVTEGAIYKSSNDSIAKVDNSGVVEGTGRGSATIQVSYKDKTQNCSVTVVSANPSIAESIVYDLLNILNWLVSIFG